MNFESLVSVILEKDNRPKILKIGFSQEVADYLHNLNDKYSLWFADKINKMPEYQAARDKLNFVRNLQTSMQSILDWIRGEQNINLNTFDWETAVQSSREFHDRLTVTHRDKETNTIIKEYPDGFYWVDIESQSDACERSSMGHCARTDKGDTLYSLRKYDNTIDKIEAFITMSISPDEGTWYQCKGKKNSKPKEEYYSYIVDILIEKEVFTFETEYDARNDFTEKQFKEYLEENPEKYPNTDEILEKINSSSIDFSDFQKILDSYKEHFGHYDVYISDHSDSGGVYSNYSFSIEIKPRNQFPIECLKLGHRSPALNYFNYVIDAHATDVNVDGDKDGVTIYALLEDSDNSFNMDEQGLKSFERQCEYYKNLNEVFDDEEFLNEHLKKLLILDGCMESDFIDFRDYVKEKFKDFYEIKQNDRTLDFTIKLKNIHEFEAAYHRDNLSFHSVLTSTGNTLPSVTDLGKTRGFSSDKHPDIFLLCTFWDFIKENVLVDYSKKMIVVFHDYGETFDIQFNYSFDDKDVDYDYENEALQVLFKKRDTIQTAFQKFMKQIFVPFVSDKIPMTVDDLEIRPTSHGRGVYIYTKDDYFLDLYLDALLDKPTPEYLENLIKKKNLDNGYRKKINTMEIEEWLELNINNQPLLPSFKDFFESRNWIKVYGN